MTVDLSPPSNPPANTPRVDVEADQPFPQATVRSAPKSVESPVDDIVINSIELV